LVGSPLRSRDGLNWDINANYSTYKEVLQSVYDGANSIFINDHTYYIGDRLDDIYGTKFVRNGSGQIINSGGEPISAPGTATDSNYGLLGHADPDFSFGITNHFSYHNFTISFEFDGRIGGSIYDYEMYKAYNGGTAPGTAEGAYGAARAAEWASTDNDTKPATPEYVGPGVVITSGTPQFGPGGVITNMSQLTFAPNTQKVFVQSYISSGIGGNFDEAYMISRSFAKLREADIGYNFPSSVLQGTFIKKASINIVGRNLLYFAAHKDIDLDEYASGYDADSRVLTGQGEVGNPVTLSSPTARRFGLNLHLTF
jgi:hypothetical protein